MVTYLRTSVLAMPIYAILRSIRLVQFAGNHGVEFMFPRFSNTNRRAYSRASHSSLVGKRFVKT